MMLTKNQQIKLQKVLDKIGYTIDSDGIVYDCRGFVLLHFNGGSYTIDEMIQICDNI